MIRRIVFILALFLAFDCGCISCPPKPQKKEPAEWQAPDLNPECGYHVDYCKDTRVDPT